MGNLFNQPRKFINTLVFTSSCLCVFFAGVFYTVELSRSRDNTPILLNQLLDNVEFSSAIAAYTNNEQIAKEVVQGLIGNEIIQNVKISGDQGLFYEQTNPPLIKNSLKIKRLLLSPFDNKQVIGSISISSKGTYQLVEAKSGALRSAIYAILSITITSSVLAWLFKHQYINPLNYISRILHESLRHENLTTAAFEQLKNDELDNLVTDINKLLALLDEKEINLRNLKAKIDGFEMKLPSSNDP